MKKKKKHIIATLSVALNFKNKFFLLFTNHKKSFILVVKQCWQLRTYMLCKTHHKAVTYDKNHWRDCIFTQQISESMV